MSHQESQTYEQTAANTTLKQTPDPIHWNQEYSFRKQPYRHLNHQNGIIGSFTVRLVEARGLKRSHWSVLGMGVVKHLGLSNAHGEVSSFASMKLGFRFRSKDVSNAASSSSSFSSSSSSMSHNSPVLNDLNRTSYGNEADWQPIKQSWVLL